MKKLHVKTVEGWKPVFCHRQGKIVTCEDKRKALPPAAIWANDDLSFFQSKFANHEFCLM
jgi:hypothetical protein